MELTQEVLDKYWAGVVKSDGCWSWTKAKNKGYGFFARREDGKRKTTYAHRVSYLIHHGPIPEGMFICHHCDNPECTNPDHLFLGTHQDNMNDMWSKGRGGTSAVIGEARRRARNGENVWELSQELGLDYNNLVKSVQGVYHQNHPEPPVPDADIYRPRKVTKLSKEQVQEIQERLKKHYHGLSNVLAREYGVSHTTISLIRHGKYPGVSP